MNEDLLIVAALVGSGALIDGPLPIMDMLCVPLALGLALLAVFV